MHGAARAGGVLAVTLALLLSAACTDAEAPRAQRAATASPGESSVEPPRKNGLEIEAERLATANRILASRTRAVARHDERAWLAPLERDNTGLMARERRLFRNLARLPLAGYRLHAVKEWTWPEDDAAPKYAATAFLPYVEETTRLRGFDPEPVTTMRTYTFARVDGTWRIVSDDDVPEVAGGVGSLPWHTGDIRVRRSAHTLGVFDRGTVGAADRVMAWAEQATARVRASVPAGWTGRVVFYAPSDNRILRGMGRRSLSAAAVAFPIPDNDMWGDHLATSRVLVNARYLPADRDWGVYLLSHEFTHVALGAGDAAAPTWVEEGLAELVASRFGDPGDWRPAPPSVAAALRGVHEMPGSTFFGMHHPDVDYDVSLAAFVVLTQRFGRARVWRFLRQVDTGDPGNADARTDTVLRRDFGFDSRRLARLAGRLLLQRAA